jgi:hypothetical protein
MDNLDPVNTRAIQDLVRAEQDVVSQKLVIERLAASNLDVSWAEMNLREMSDHLKLVQSNLDILESVNRNAVI